MVKNGDVVTTSATSSTPAPTYFVKTYAHYSNGNITPTNYKYITDIKYSCQQQNGIAIFSTIKKYIEKLKEKDPDMIANIDKLKNQILYSNKENEI